jgi:hypothetical protein
MTARAQAAQAERDIRAAVWAALSDWIVRCARAVFRTGQRPDADAVHALAPAWRAAVDLIVHGAIEDAVSLAYRTLFGDDHGYRSRAAVTRYLAEVTNRLVGVPDEVFDLVAAQISQGVNLGEGIPKLAARVDNILSIEDQERWPNRATVIARTETIGALNAGRNDAFKAFEEEQDPDEPELEKFWLATDDSRTRPHHREAEGQRVPVGEPFRVGSSELMFPGDPSGPPEEIIQCVLGSTQLGWPGQAVHGSTSRRYEGAMIQLITAEGHDLTITPNHPVLTTTGYVPAGLLRPGQHVLGTLEPPTPHVRDAPPRAEEIHGALRQAGEPEWVMGSRMDFHGDGSDTEVEVVPAYGNLTRYVDRHGFSQALDLGFVRLSDRERPLSGLGGAVVTRMPVPGAPRGVFADSLVSRTGELAPFSGGEPREPEPVGLTTASDLQAQTEQMPDDGRTAEADFPAHLQYALAAGMAPCEIVQVKRLTGDHLVYNLSTSDHWFTGNGIALHNCRCTMLLVEIGEDVDMSDRQTRRGR